MKKAFYVIGVALFTSTLLVACEAETIDEQVEILSPDKRKHEPIGKDN